MTAAASARRKLPVLTALAAALAASGAQSASSSRLDACVGASGGRAKVGSITRIIHTAVFVERRYTATAPCDLFADDDVRTDGRGEAVLQLAVGGQETRCALLQRVTLGVYPSRAPVPSSRVTTVAFSAGRTWCSRRGRTLESVYGAGNVTLRTRGATFGVEVDRGTVLVKVASGTVRVQAGTARAVVLPRKAALISPAGRIKGPVPARFDAKDGLALARLR